MYLMNYIVDELFTLADHVKNQGIVDHALLESKSKLRYYTTRLQADAHITLAREMNSPALSIVLVSLSRTFLKYNFGCLRSLYNDSKSGQPYGPQRQVYRELEAIFDKSPVTIPQFERILSDLDSDIKNAYSSSKMSDADRKNTEKGMLVSGRIPAVLTSALESLLTISIESLRDEIDEAELYFTDISWIGLSDDGRSDAWRRDHALDVLRKIELPKDAPLKRCTRCCAVVEDKSSDRGASSWILNFHRTCFCGNWWMVDSKEGT